MNFRRLFDFLRDLNENNHKDWMDAHREEYEAVRDSYIHWLNKMDIQLAAIDPDYTHTPGKKAINRINNNLLFHPDKPTYKDNFGAGLDKKKGESDFYIHLGINECFIAGGYYKPAKQILDSIRAAIDYNGEKLEATLNKPSFKKMFGDMIEEEELKTAPKGYSRDHRYIDYLRQKTFVVMKPLTQKEVISSGFDQKVIDIYKEMLPFRRYLNKAVSV